MEVRNSEIVHLVWEKMGCDRKELDRIFRTLLSDSKTGTIISNCMDVHEYKATLDKGKYKNVYIAYLPRPSGDIWVIGINKDSFSENLTDQQKAEIRRLIRKLFL